MAKKMLVSLPSYSYVLLDPATLEKVLNAPRYEYDWEKKVYWVSDNEHTEVRVCDTAQLQDTVKPPPAPKEEEQDNG